MRISNAQIHKVLELHVHRVQGPAGSSAAGHVRKPDQLTLSSKASEVTQTRHLVGRLPDLRVGMVKDFRGQVETGSYKVSGLEVANDLLASVLMSRSRF